MDRFESEHQQVFQLYTVALEALRAGAVEASRRAVSDFHAGTAKHFESEDRVMRDTAYPQHGIHREAHQLYLADLAALRARLDCAHELAPTRLWFESRCSSWWKHHLRTNDAALASFLAAREAAGRSP